MLNYKMITYTIDTTEGKEYVSEYPALLGVLGTGKTDLESIEDLKLNAEEHIKFMREMNMNVPEEDNELDLDEFSGKISYRPGKFKHKLLSENSQKIGLSINSLINDAVSSYLVNLDKLSIESEILDKLNSIKNQINTNHIELRNNYSKQIGQSAVFTENKGNFIEQFAA